MTTATSLSDQLKSRIDELERLAGGIAEDDASRAAEGEWSLKEVLSHLAGDAQQSFREGCERFLREDKPDLGLTPGESYVTDERQNASAAELLSSVTGQYRQLADWYAGLSPADLERRAHVPFLKETPLTDYPTLQGWMTAIVNFHLPAHIEQLQKLRG